MVIDRIGDLGYFPAKLNLHLLIQIIDQQITNFYSRRTLNESLKGLKYTSTDPLETSMVSRISTFRYFGWTK